RFELGVSHEGNLASHLRLDCRLGKQSGVPWSAWRRQRWLHPRRLSHVVGELEKTQWSDEFVGKEFRGYGVGTHHLVSHGVLPDMCLLGEPTDLQLVLGHYGTVWVRLSVHGHYVHTGFTRGKQDLNSVFRMKEILPAIYDWKHRVQI